MQYPKHRYLNLSGLGVCLTLTASAAFCGLATFAQAEEIFQIERKSAERGIFRLVSKEKFVSAMVHIGGPRGFRARAVSKAGMPLIELPKSEFRDGVYKYEITAIQNGKVFNEKSLLDNGREGKERSNIRPVITDSGSFVVRDGKIDLEIALRKENNDE